MNKLIFVCIENSTRGQMVQAVAKIHCNGVVEVYSAGSRSSEKYGKEDFCKVGDLAETKELLRRIGT